MTYTNGTIFCENYILDNDGNRILSPSLETLTTLGWSIVIDRDLVIHRLIRNKYSENKEFQILRKKDIDPETFNEYNEYVEECIRKADEELSKLQ